LALANLNNPTTIAHYDFAFVNPWTKRITFFFKTFKTIITIEDGVTKGGFGSAILSLPPKTTIPQKYNYWEYLMNL
jgi:1-deoxy-D-xylulose-5-phosphate synthase